MSAQRDVRPILGAGFNHVQGLRDALCWTLAGKALPSLSSKEVATWIRDQGLELDEVASPEPLPAINCAVDAYWRSSLGEFWRSAIGFSTSPMNPTSKGYGLDRSGAGWNRGAAFCITSAFVRLLGASEQFELDVLKALLHFRPHGQPLGHQDDQIDVTNTLEVLQERPRADGGVEYYEKPAIWTWIKRVAEGNDERRKIFSRVFGLELTPGEKEKERKENNKRRTEWYNKRNKVAHGREAVEMTLGEYVDVDVFVTKSMLHLAVQCQKKQRLII